MRKILKWGLRVVLLLLLIAIGLGIWKREEVLRLWAVNSLFDEGVIVGNFSNMERAFLTVEVPNDDGPVSDLPKGVAATMPAATTAWINDRAVTSKV